MEIPTDDEGMFEAVDGGGAVVGHGIVSDEGLVDFAYTDGTHEDRALLPIEAFGDVWATFQLGRGLTLRAAA